MRVATALILSLCLSTAALAADATCGMNAKDKKLHGAALKSFMTKCEKDARMKCTADANSKKLHGAAEKSFTTKCVRDATGA